MNECTKKRILISSLIDNEISFEQRCELEQHLQKCEKCFIIYKKYKSVSAILHTVFSDKPLPVFNMLKNSKKNLIQKLFDTTILFPVSGFAVIILLVLSLYVQNNLQSKQSSLITETSSSAMSLPLSSFSFYGSDIEDTLQSSLSKTINSDYSEEASEDLFLVYESPLFNDKLKSNDCYYHSAQLFLE